MFFIIAMKLKQIIMYKKMMLFGLAALTVGIMGSCKKDYVCDCHLDDMDDNHSDEEVVIESAKKGEAEEDCIDIENNFEAMEMYKHADCQLK